LPTEQLNALLIDIGSYLPSELEEVNDDMFKVNVRNYLSSSTNDIHELFKKVRILLKLYFSKNKEIVAMIVKEKSVAVFQKILQNTKVKTELKHNLSSTAENQFGLRIKIMEGLYKLL